MSTQSLGGRFTFPGTALTVNRIGYGAMQLTGPGVWGPPKDVDAAVALLRDAVAAGVNQIDTADFYGPHVSNQLIRKALHPYPSDLVIVTKVGARRPPDGSVVPAVTRQELIDAVHDNLRVLGVEALDIVNYRVMAATDEPPIAEQIIVLAELQRKGLIRHVGVSNVTPIQVVEARAVANIVCVQNRYNVAERDDDLLIDDLAREGIAYVPFWPLGGHFTAPVSDDLHNCEPNRSNAATGRSSLVTAALSERSIDSRHIFDCTPARKPRCRHADPVGGRRGGVRWDRLASRAPRLGGRSDARLRGVARTRSACRACRQDLRLEDVRRDVCLDDEC